MSSIEEVKENTSNINEKEEKQICIAIEKYLSLIMIEFKEHISKYKLFYENVFLRLFRSVKIQVIISLSLNK